MPSKPSASTTSSIYCDPPQFLWGGVLLGIGSMAAVDEIIFHQLLSWHHFYDRATPAIGLLSDGLLHAAELLALAAGFFILLEAKRIKALAAEHDSFLKENHSARIRTCSGFLLGAGGFQLFDGTINHKLLRLHQIRYNVDILPYDLLWNGFALMLIMIGWLSHPISALFLNIGGMYVLYLTPLYETSLHSTAVHYWVHIHFLMAGYLFAWAIAGPDSYMAD